MDEWKALENYARTQKEVNRVLHLLWRESEDWDGLNNIFNIIRELGIEPTLIKDPNERALLVEDILEESKINTMVESYEPGYGMKEVPGVQGEFQAWWEKYHSMFVYHVLADLTRVKEVGAVAFSCPDGFADLLAMTTPSRDLSDLALPFKDCWLDGEFDSKHRRYYGIYLIGAPDPASPRPTYALSIYKDKASNEMGLLTIGGVFDENYGQVLNDMHPYGKVERKFVLGVIENWLRVLDSEQVVTKKRALSKRDLDMYERTHGGQAPSEFVVIKPTDPALIRALESIQQFGKLNRQAHYVRGHWKHFRSERYKDMRGKKTWVHPFIRGEGIATPKVYKHQGVKHG